MRELKILFEKNRQWAEEHIKHDPDYFQRLSESQKPIYLWIGCSDSRIPANEVVGLAPGELFVHRNVANLFIHTDFNCLSVLQYAIDYLQIKHVIVCGHYGCGGVEAALGDEQLGLVDNWLRNIRDVYARSKDELEAIKDDKLRCNRLVELNVIQQVLNIGHTTVVQNGWSRGQKISVHGWLYDLPKGRLIDLKCCVSSPKQLEEIYLTS
ncbi:MAG: Carbonic anhydrase 2 [Chlamydiae bacterium]|nr:Carbonic anhydrase 2 [Chlamydiota bacterium]